MAFLGLGFFRCQHWHLNWHSNRFRTPMDIIKMLQELRSERAQIEQAILTLERLARGQGKRRGRLPKWMSEKGGADSTPSQKSHKKPVLSPVARARIAAGQRKRWATARQTQG